jgi:hypothetical protein
VRFLKFNLKKLDYILNLTHDGRVKSVGDFYGFTLKGNVQVPSGFSVITPAGNQVGPGQSFSVGNAMLEDGSKVTDFDSFKQWISSGKETTSSYQILEVGEGETSTYDGGFSQEYIESNLSPGFSKIKEKEQYASFVRDLISDLNLFTNPDNLDKDLEKFNFLYGYYIQQADENNVDTDLITDVFNGYLEENLEDKIRDGKVARIVYEGNLPTGAGKTEDKKKDDIDGVTVEDEYSWTENVAEDVVQGNMDGLLRIVFSGRRGLLNRVCEEAANRCLEELVTLKNDPSLGVDEQREIDYAIRMVEALSPKTHQETVATFFGFDMDTIKEILASYRVDGAKVFDENGLVLREYKSKIDDNHLALHFLKERFKLDLIASGASVADAETKSNELYKTLYAFSTSGPFLLRDYVNLYANSTALSRTERRAIRRNPKIVNDLDMARVKLVTTPFNITEDGVPVREGGLTVSQILNHESQGFRELNGRKVLFELRSLPTPDNELDAIVLELTIEKLERHLNSDGIKKRVPPAELIGSDFLGSEKFGQILDMYYSSRDYVYSLAEISSPHNAGTGVAKKLVQKNLFLTDKTLISEGFVDDISELVQAAGNVPVLGWTGSGILNATYNLIVENFDDKQRAVLERIDKLEGFSDSEKETLKHRYAAVQFGKSPEKFPLDFINAVSSVLSTVFGHSENSVTQMDESSARKIREKFDDVIKRISPEVLMGLHNYGLTLANLGKPGYPTKPKEVMDNLVQTLMGNISDSSRSQVKLFLESTQKKSKSSTGSSTVGYHAEAALYAVMAANSVPEGGSLEFEEVPSNESNRKRVKMKILTVKDKNGSIIHQFIDHGNPAGLCDMAVVTFKDGKPEALISSELKVYDTGKAVMASFNELAGFSRIITYLKQKHDISTVNLAGAQQINILENGSKSEVMSGAGKVSISERSTGNVNFGGSQ